MYADFYPYPLKMKKLLLTLAATLFLVSGCKKDGENNLLKVGTSADYIPFAFVKEGKIVGFEIDLAKKICEELKCTVEFQDLPFDSLIGALQAKRLDMVIAAMNKTKEREKVVSFSKPYHVNGSVMVMLKSAPIKSHLEAKGKAGAQSGSIHEEKARKFCEDNKNITVHTMAKIPDLVQDLIAGRLIFIVLGETEAKALVKEHPELQYEKIADVVDGEFCMALPTGSPWLEKVNATLEKLKANGTVAALAEKWLKISGEVPTAGGAAPGAKDDTDPETIEALPPSEDEEMPTFSKDAIEREKKPAEAKQPSAAKAS